MDNWNAINLTIPISTDETNTVDIKGFKLFVLLNPVVTTVLYSIKVGQESDGSDAAAVVDSAGAAVTFTATDSKAIVLDNDKLVLALAAAQYMSLVAVTGAEGTARDLVLLAAS